MNQAERLYHTFSWTLYCSKKIAIQKQPLVGVSQNRCPEKFRNIHRKTPVLKSLFEKVPSILQTPTQDFKDSTARIFLWILQNLSKQLFLIEQYFTFPPRYSTDLSATDEVSMSKTAAVHRLILYKTLTPSEVVPKQNSHLPKIFVLFASLKVFWKWWKTIFILLQKLFSFSRYLSFWSHFIYL